jgi:hypothetical protein
MADFPRAADEWLPPSRQQARRMSAIERTLDIAFTSGGFRL